MPPSPRACCARPAAVVLAATLVPTTLAGHRFWEEDDPAARRHQTIHVLKNVAMMGGLLLAAADTGGRPSVPWRAKRAVGHAGAVVREHTPLALLRPAPPAARGACEPACRSGGRRGRWYGGGRRSPPPAGSWARRWRSAARGPDPSVSTTRSSGVTEIFPVAIGWSPPASRTFSTMSPRSRSDVIRPVRARGAGGRPGAGPRSARRLDDLGRARRAGPEHAASSSASTHIPAPTKRTTPASDKRQELVEPRAGGGPLAKQLKKLCHQPVTSPGLRAGREPARADESGDLAVPEEQRPERAEIGAERRSARRAAVGRDVVADARSGGRRRRRSCRSRSGWSRRATSKRSTRVGHGRGHHRGPARAPPQSSSAVPGGEVVPRA